jgi:hypothetical protein
MQGSCTPRGYAAGRGALRLVLFAAIATLLWLSPGRVAHAAPAEARLVGTIASALWVRTPAMPARRVARVAPGTKKVVAAKHMSLQRRPGSPSRGPGPADRGARVPSIGGPARAYAFAPPARRSAVCDATLPRCRLFASARSARGPPR